MDKRAFCTLMGVVELSSKELTATAQKFSELFDDFDGVPKGMAKVEDALVDALENLTGNTGLVEYWVYDCFFGEVPVTLTYDDGTEISVSSTEELYDFIKARTRGCCVSN